MKKVVLITGGSRGIGAATARLSAKQGFAVGINYNSRADSAESLVREIVEAGGEAIAIKGDVGNEDEVKAMFAEVDRRLGRVTALVNNAGILEPQSTVSAMNANRLRRIFEINSIGPFLCAKEAILRMSTRNGGAGGSIVNVSSTAVKKGGSFEYVDYAASKGALEVFSAGLALEVAGEGIRVNVVRPGSVYTEIHASGGEPGRVDRIKDTIPLKRGGQPEEIARAIVWFLSEESSYCTGSVLDVSGGK